MCNLRQRFGCVVMNVLLFNARRIESRLPLISLSAAGETTVAIGGARCPTAVRSRRSVVARPVAQLESARLRKLALAHKYHATERVYVSVRRPRRREV